MTSVYSVIINMALGMGRTWEKFSSLPAKKPQPEKKTFSPTEDSRISGS